MVVTGIMKWISQANGKIFLKVHDQVTKSFAQIREVFDRMLADVWGF